MPNDLDLDLPKMHAVCKLRLANISSKSCGQQRHTTWRPHTQGKRKKGCVCVRDSERALFLRPETARIARTQTVGGEGGKQIFRRTPTKGFKAVPSAAVIVYWDFSELAVVRSLKNQGYFVSWFAGECGSQR
jgi:hypothetical protein